MTYHGTSDLVWQPDLRVSTFPSGLILAQRSAVGRSNIEYTSGLSVGNDMTSRCPNVPNDGGIYVFPAPQRKDDPAWTTFDVSGYGRVSDEVKEKYEEVPLKGISITVGELSITVRVVGRRCVQTGVISSFETTPFTVPANAGDTTITWSDGDETTDVSSGSTAWMVESTARTNYGSWDEFTVVWTTPPTGTASFPVGGGTGTITW